MHLPETRTSQGVVITSHIDRIMTDYILVHPYKLIVRLKILELGCKFPIKFKHSEKYKCLNTSFLSFVAIILLQVPPLLGVDFLCCHGPKSRAHL